MVDVPSDKDTLSENVKSTAVIRHRVTENRDLAVGWGHPTALLAVFGQAEDSLR